MSTTIIKTDNRAFISAIDRFLTQSKKTRPEMMKQQAKLILKTVIDVTPPGSKGVSGKKAEDQGKSALAGDVAKVLAGARKAKPADIKSLHERFRASGGRVRTNLKRGDEDKRIRVPAAELKRYIALRQKKVGYLVSGWASAASKLGVKMAKWMLRNSAPSACNITVTGSGIRIEATNSANFAGNVKDMDRRIQWAMDVQRQNIELQIAKFESRQHKASGLS